MTKVKKLRNNEYYDIQDTFDKEVQLEPIKVA